MCDLGDFMGQNVSRTTRRASRRFRIPKLAPLFALGALVFFAANANAQSTSGAVGSSVRDVCKYLDRTIPTVLNSRISALNKQFKGANASKAQGADLLLENLEAGALLKTLEDDLNLRVDLWTRLNCFQFVYGSN